MFVGPIRYVKPEELEKWLREVTPIPFVHIIKKYSNGYGHLHFDSHQESSAFYNLMKDVIKESPYGKIRFIAAQYFSTKLQVTYMNTFDNNEKKRKMIEIENNNENDEQSLDLPYNLYETRQEFIIIMDVPNVKSKNEISISVRKNHIIKIEGNICRNSIPGKQLHSKNPLPFGKFKIEVNLPENIDFEESVNVNVEAGVAILEIKKELVKSLKIS